MNKVNDWLKNNKKFLFFVFVIVFFSFGFFLLSFHDVNAYEEHPQIPLYPFLKWNNKVTKNKILSLDEYVYPVNASGFFYQSEPFLVNGKPPEEMTKYYFPENMKNYDWNLVGYIDKPNSIGVMYQHSTQNRYLAVFIEDCNLIDKEFGTVKVASVNNYCINIWYSNVINKQDATLNPTSVNGSHGNTLEPYSPNLSLSYSNPLPVPFFSQRNSDPNNNIILGFGSSCTATIHDYGCALTAYTMVYDYFQPNYTSVTGLNDSMKVSPGIYSCEGNCCNLWPVAAPDAPSGLSFGTRYINNCSTANCIDSANVTVIDNAINSGLPLHARVHYKANTLNTHSIVIIGHSGSTYYIKDPWATDDTQRTLSSGALGQYVVDYIDTYNGSPSNQITASWSSPSNGQNITSSTVHLQANVSGGTNGVNHVSFSAAWGGSWHGVQDVYSSPWGYDWNMCNSGVPNGDIELGLIAVDNAGNQYVYSEHNSNYHITKSYTCPTGPTTPSNPNPGDGTTVSRTNDTTFSWSTNGTSCDIHIWGGPSIDTTQSGVSCSSFHWGSQWPGTYQWQVIAHNSYGTTTGPTWHLNIQPYAPTNLNASPSSQTQINLSWTKSSDDPGSVDNYKVYLSNGTYIATLNPGSNSYTVNNLTCGNTYSFYITAIRQGVESTSSNTASTNTQSCGTPPSTPSNPSPADNAIVGRTNDTTLSWSTNGTTCDIHIWGGPSIDTTQNGISCSGLHWGSQWPGVYQWQVTAHNSYGTTTGPTWHLNIQPYAPLNLNASATSQTQINLSWTKSNDDPGSIDNYKVYYLSGSNITTLTSGTTNYLVSNLNCGSSYSFYIRTIRQGVESVNSNTAGATTQPCSFGKSLPANGSTGISTSPTLTWGTSNGATGYEYCYDTTNDNACSNWTTTGTNTSIVLSGLSSNTNYYWQVRSNNSSGSTYANGSYSAFWSFKTVTNCYALITTVNPTNSGNVTANPSSNCPGGSGYSSGTVVQLTANPNTGYSFSNWDGALSGSSNPASVVMDGDKAVTANFVDSQAPSLKWIAPIGDGQVVDVGNQIIQLEVSASDNVGVTQVHITRWDYKNLVSVDIATITTPPYRISFNTNVLLPDWNEIDAAASDAAGNSTYSYIWLNHANPSPTLSSISPTGVLYGNVAINMTLVGTNFVNGSVARWGTTDLTTTFVNSTTLTASVPASLLTNAGSASISVFNPTPGGGTSESLPFTIYPADTWFNNGPTGQYISALAIPPGSASTIFAGAKIVYKSIDRGGNWPSSSNGLSVAEVHSIIVDPSSSSTLYAGTETSGVYKSTDGGTNWTQSNTGLSNKVVEILAINPSTPSILYAGTLGGLFKSTNGGVNWTSANSGLTGQYINSIVIDPANPNTLYAGAIISDDGVYKSTNGGTSWVLSSNGLPSSKQIYSLAIDPINTSTIYAGVWGVGVYKTIDGGVNWSPANVGYTGENIWALSINPSNTNIVYAATGNDVIRSSDAGYSWFKVSSGLGIIHSLAISPTNSNILFVGTGSGVSIVQFSALPGGFNKSSPANGATGVQTSPTLIWGSSNGATSYEYCYDTTNDNACTNWISVGANTSIALSGLSSNTTYYWHVRANNNNGVTYSNNSATAFWNFTTGNVSGAFGKSTPSNGSTSVSTSLTLTWGTSNGATSYEYCYDTTNDNACANWTSNGTAISKALSGLNTNTTYYWHVRANNSNGTTYADGAATAFWSFTTGNIPGAFGKSTPSNDSTGVSTSLTLTWGASNGATSYEYCYDTTNDNACSNWTSNGMATSKALSELSNNTTYYWHVRAVNSFGTTYANGSSTTFWSFTTGNVPGSFSRTTPANGDTGQSTSPTLNWGTSSGATSYEFCYDTSNDKTCTNWTSNGTDTSRALSGLAQNTTYYWHVRAVNSFGTTYADGAATTFWSFTTNSKGVVLAVNPASSSASVGQSFDIVLEVRAGNQLVDGACAYLNFDTTYLSAVSITPGTSLTNQLLKEIDPVGHINYCAGNVTNFPSGTFTLATVTFHAIKETASTPLTFNALAPRKRDVPFGGYSVLDSSLGGTVDVELTNLATINGSATLQGRPTPPNARWSVPLRITLTVPGNNQPAYSYTKTTDTSGHFSLTGITPGTYDVRVKHSHTLQNLKRTTLVAGVNTIDFGTLQEGDAKDDNDVNITDFSILATTYSKCEGVSGYDSRADFNGDTCTELLDFSWLATNFGKTGDIALNSTTPIEKARLSSGSVLIVVDPQQSNVMVGDTFTVAIKLQAGSQMVDGAQASLDFDPTKLQVKSLKGNTTAFPNLLISNYDNKTGKIDYAAGAVSNFPSGTFTLVEIEFKAIGGASSTSLTFHYGAPPRNTNVTKDGSSVLSGDLDGQVKAEFKYRTFIPVVIR